jgi:hypothetical protein
MPDIITKILFTGEKTMKLVLNIVAILLLLTGSGWFLQGIGVLPGSFMSGAPEWAVIGGVCIVAAVGLLVFNTRRKKVA